MEMKRLEKLMLVAVVVLGICVLSYLYAATPARSAGPSDLGRIVTSLGSVDYSGFQTLTPTSSSASSLTPTLSGQEKAFITLATGSVRFRMDGTAPTTSVGHLLLAGENVTLNTRGQIDNFKAISVSTHGVLSINYGR
jgi:hypothetical protein